MAEWEAPCIKSEIEKRRFISNLEKLKRDFAGRARESEPKKQHEEQKQEPIKEEEGEERGVKYGIEMDSGRSPPYIE